MSSRNQDVGREEGGTVMAGQSNHTHTPAPPVISTQSFGYCSGTRHGPRKRVAIFSEQGLHQWCGSCHSEVIFTWEELDQIHAGLQRQSQNQTKQEAS